MYIVLDISRSYHALEKEKDKVCKKLLRTLHCLSSLCPLCDEAFNMHDSRGWIQIQTSKITAKKQNYLSDPLPNPWRKT